MNLNKKITKFKGEGIPAYNGKINELIDASNWFAGIRTINGKAIAESDQGPVIDLSQASSTQPSNGAMEFDPDGNKAGWVKMTMMNLVNGNLYDAWVWAGPSSNLRPIPWWQDLNGTQAGWLTGSQGEVWGTGNYPGAPSTGNFQPVKFQLNHSSPGPSPTIWTGNAASSPISPPANPPSLYLISSVPSSGAVDVPYFTLGNPSGGIYPPPITVTYSWQITYDGTTVFSYSSSYTFTISGVTQSAVDIPLDKTGWVFDPAGLAGYSQGGKRWIYKYQGPISTNTNPTVIETFTYSLSSGIETFVLNWDAVLLTA